MAKANFKITGMKELQKSLKELGKTPQKHVTSSVKKGMNIILRSARANAPYDTGQLKKGIISVGEKSDTKGKKVYRLVYDRKMNSIFQKPNKEGKITGYYPVSQEYGFFAKNGRYIPGYRFIHGSFSEKAEAAESKIITEMKKKIDAEIEKRGLK